MQTIPFLRGVNLGGWLVLERWMTPSLFENTDARDEFTFMGTPDAVEKIRNHRREYITEEDFSWLKKQGINALRIPVGYWVFGGEEPFLGAIKELDWAIAQAKKNNLLVLLDLHGAPGSQNGRDHSGQVGKSAWYDDRKHREKTIEILVRLVKRYRSQKHVFGIELVNEPRPHLFNIKLRRFYNDAYKRIVEVARKGFYVIFHDAFTPRLMSGAIRNPNPDFPVIIDNHWYQFLEDFLNHYLTVTGYFFLLRKRQRLYRRLHQKQKVIVGEWSIVLSEKMLRGMDETEKIKLMVEHGEIQKEIYERFTDGWFYWSYKTESPGIWNFRSQVEEKNIII